MVTMMSNSMINNLSCMLRATDEFQANMQGRSIASDDWQAQVDSELARENVILRQQLLEAAADNNAISKSLQERVQSLADTTDAKIKAETEVKMLQVQVKSMQKNLDVHQYELGLLRKQVQIRNEEKEHHKKASDASYKQHLENVKKIARLESECQRLRGLIRQRIPGPAAIAQMRAECDIHIKMGINKKPLSAASKSLHNSSSLQGQREIEGLKERLLSVEDEATFLKEAVTKRTTELQEARQLCARTAMKLSVAQALVESVTSMTNITCSTATTPTHLQSMFDSDHLYGLPTQEVRMLKSNGFIGEINGVYALSSMHKDVDDDGVIDVNSNSELKSASHINDVDDDLADEVSCAETWASALFDELSHLSNLHENASATNQSVVESYTSEASTCKKEDVILDATAQELEINSALQMVHQKLSSVGKTLFISFKNQADSCNMVGAKNDTESMWGMKDTNPSARNERNHDMLEEILQIKGLLLNISAAMEMGNGSTEENGYVYMNGDESGCSGEPIVKQEGQKLATFKEGRGLSRLRYNSLEDEDNVSAGFSEESGDLEFLANEFREQTDEMENVCTRFSDKTVVLGAHGSEQTNLSTRFSEEVGISTKSSDETDMGSIKCGEKIVQSKDDSIVKNSTSSHGTNIAVSAAGEQLNLAAATNDKIAGEKSDFASEPEAVMELQRLLHSVQAELELARGRIVSLEAELASCMQEKVDVANELDETRSLKQSLEAELACAVASVEDFKLQLSSLQGLISSEQGDFAPFHGETPTLDRLDVHANVKEEQELAAARAQLADCQRSIHVIRKQIATEMQHVDIQDVIHDEQVLFDTSSESSKSTELSSHLPSPILDYHSLFVMPSSNAVQPMEVDMIRDECNTPHFPSIPKSCALQEEDNSQAIREVDGHATKQQTQQNREECKSHDDDIKSKTFMYSIEPSSKKCVPRTTQSLPKPAKTSTTSRISEFFNRAKSTTRRSER
ncbi:hypothetical protein L7F22_012479 [Adiantum nelumboides]|nr:hypothetical protein [Adiantum nelumboides]